jgi:integrase/recombinase XerD
MDNKKKQLIPTLEAIDYPQVIVPWPEVIKAFLESVDLRESTIESYRRRLKQFVLWLKENKINHPTPIDMIQFKKDISLRCSSSLTVGNYLVASRSFFRWCQRRKIYPDISQEVRNPTPPSGHRKDALELSQIQELLSSIERVTLKGKRDYALCRLLIAAGPRGIEVWRSNIEDIRKKNGVWVCYLQGKGQDEKSELVILAPTVLEAIEGYLFLRNYKSKKEPLFTSLSTNYKGRLSTRSIRGVVKIRLRAIGINSLRLSAHSCRHSAITLSLLAGNGLQETQQLARHKNINTTISFYAHNLKTLANPAFASVDEMIESKKK